MRKNEIKVGSEYGARLDARWGARVLVRVEAVGNPDGFVVETLEDEVGGGAVLTPKGTRTVLRARCFEVTGAGLKMAREWDAKQRAETEAQLAVAQKAAAALQAAGISARVLPGMTRASVVVEDVTALERLALALATPSPTFAVARRVAEQYEYEQKNLERLLPPGSARTTVGIDHDIGQAARAAIGGGK